MRIVIMSYVFLFFFKQKTAYEMRISDWSSDVCSSDLALGRRQSGGPDRDRRLPTRRDERRRAPAVGRGVWLPLCWPVRTQPRLPPMQEPRSPDEGRGGH